MSYFSHSICRSSSSCHHVIMLFRATNACVPGTYNVIPGYSVVVTPPACLPAFLHQNIPVLPPHPRLSEPNALAAPMLIKNRCSRNPASGLAEAYTFPVRLLSRSAGFRKRTRQRCSASPSPWHRSSSTSPPAGLVACPGSGSCTASLSPSSGSP